MESICSEGEHSHAAFLFDLAPIYTRQTATIIQVYVVGDEVVSIRSGFIRVEWTGEGGGVVG